MFQVMAEEGDNMAQVSDHESILESTLDLSSHFNSQNPDTALTLVRSVLTRRRQAVQVRTPAFLLTHKSGCLK